MKYNLLEKYDLSSIKEINFSGKLNSGDNLGVIVADNKLDNAEISENYKINNNYEVNMIIQTDDGKKNVRIEAKTNPTKFINKVKNKLLQ